MAKKKLTKTQRRIMNWSSKVPYEKGPDKCPRHGGKGKCSTCFICKLESRF